MRVRDASDHLKVFAEAAEHILAVLVDFFGGRRGTVLGEHAATGFKRLSRRVVCRRFLGQFSQPSLKGETLQCGFRFERRCLFIWKFNYRHG